MTTTLASDRVRFLVAGARGRTADFEYVGVADLHGVTGIVGRVWKTVGPPDRQEVEVEILDRATRMCRVHWGVEDGDWLPSQTRADSWRFEVVPAWPDAPEMPSPERYAVTLKVRASGEAPPDVEP